jgi:hypothetical protein
MALIIKTNTPKKLLSDIKKAIDDNKIRTWSYDSDGDFTHTPDQWARKAWFQVHESKDGILSFGILGQRDTNTSTLIYAVYHGRFAEMLLTHFDSDFSAIETSALPKNFDQITSNK